MYMTNKAIQTMAHAPKYVQVKEEIRRKILSKEWTDGCRIPVEAEFCEMFGVSRITVRKALEELQSEGYLVKIQGKGTFVRGQMVEQRLSKFYSFSEELRKQGVEEQATVRGLTLVSASEEMAARLQVVVGEPILEISRIRSTNHGPYAVETSYIPQRFAPEARGFGQLRPGDLPGHQCQQRAEQAVECAHRRRSHCPDKNRVQRYHRSGILCQCSPGRLLQLLRGADLRSPTYCSGKDVLHEANGTEAFCREKTAGHPDDAKGQTQRVRVGGIDPLRGVDAGLYADPPGIGDLLQLHQRQDGLR